MPTRAELSKAAEHKDEHTPLMIAALEGDTKAVKNLLAFGERINAKDNKGHTALMFAVINSHTQIVKALLRAGANVNARANDGGTALMLAATNGDKGITEILLNNGAKRGYRYTSTRKTAANLAADRGHTEVVKLLQRPPAGENGEQQHNTNLSHQARARHET